MSDLLLNIIYAVGSILLSLTVTFIFNKVVRLPKARKEQRELEAQKEAKLKKENETRDGKIAELEAAVGALPGYRAQSLQIQAQLQNTDKEILVMLSDIKDNMISSMVVLNERLDRLESREKNTIRAKLIDEYRLFTDETKNPMLAWSEMEHHAFFALVRDYEDLHGNDYVHTTIIPAMNELRIIKLEDRKALLELMNSRKL